MGLQHVKCAADYLCQCLVNALCKHIGPGCFLQLQSYCCPTEGLLGSTALRLRLLEQQVDQATLRHKPGAFTDTGKMRPFNFGPGAVPIRGAGSHLPHSTGSGLQPQSQQQQQHLRHHARLCVAAAGAATFTAGAATVMHLHKHGRLQVPQLFVQQPPVAKPAGSAPGHGFLIPRELAEVMAGAFAEIVQVAVLYPLDTIKVCTVYLCVLSTGMYELPCSTLLTQSATFLSCFAGASPEPVRQTWLWPSACLQVVVRVESVMCQSTRKGILFRCA